MTAIIKHQFQDHAIEQRGEDSYVNLTQLCKAGGKDLFDYLRQDSTKEYIEALSVDTGILGIADSAKVSSLVNRSRKGTWAHPMVAIDCAQWVNVNLRIWANRTLVQIIAQAPQSEPKALPAVPEISKRNQCRKLVDQQAITSGMQHSRLWQQAYNELEYRFGYPIAKSRAKNKLEKVENDGQIDNLLAVMHKLWD
jgi:hypothetical protein